MVLQEFLRVACFNCHTALPPTGSHREMRHLHNFVEPGLMQGLEISLRVKKNERLDDREDFCGASYPKDLL
jgi:hypothetical protein